MNELLEHHKMLLAYLDCESVIALKTNQKGTGPGGKYYAHDIYFTERSHKNVTEYRCKLTLEEAVRIKDLLHIQLEKYTLQNLKKEEDENA